MQLFCFWTFPDYLEQNLVQRCFWWSQSSLRFTPFASPFCSIVHFGPDLHWKLSNPFCSAGRPRGSPRKSDQNNVYIFLCVCYVQTDRGVYDIPITTELWIRLEHHTEISVCTKANPFIEISFEGSSCHTPLHPLSLNQPPASVQRNDVYRHALTCPCELLPKKNVSTSSRLPKGSQDKHWDN